MNPGALLLDLAFLAVVASTLLGIPALRRKGLRLSSVMFGIHTLALTAATGLLWYYFLAHRFDYSYVARYSSTVLSPALSVAASWAGQEGSILLWATIAALLGLALMRQPGSLARPALFFLGVTQVFMLLLLLVRSPFVLSPLAPADGQGLNPLLEDPWMVAHPPILFLGYAALAVPFALAGAALVRADVRDWTRMVWPWALFAVVTLGTGIALGGVWAYKVLGWGGYWGWDPVENASLIPWLIAVALLHGLMIQRTTGAVARTNLVLAILAWATVLGGTYLTRSGALQDFSVHSFTDSGLNSLLTSFLLGSLMIGGGLLAWRWRSIESRTSTWTSLSRESALWLGMVTVLLLTALVAFGTSTPLLTRLAGTPSGVQTSFYLAVSIPLGIVLVLLMGITPALRWSRQHGLSWLKALVPGGVVGLAATAGAALAGTTDPAHLALIALGGFALAVNAVMTVRLFRRGWAYGSGYLAHAGIAVMVLGMVLSTTLGQTERVRLALGESVRAMGYTLTYRGEEKDARGERRLRVSLEKPGWSFDAHPSLLETAQGTIRKPAIAHHGELYLSPVDVFVGNSRTSDPTWLDKGEETVVADVGYTFGGFRTVSQEDFTVFADIEVRRKRESTTVTPALKVGADGNHPVDAEVEGLGTLSVARIDADGGRVAVHLPTVRVPTALMDLNTKPLIALVWIGALITVLGSIMAGLRRAAEVLPARRGKEGRAHGVTKPSASRP